MPVKVQPLNKKLTAGLTRLPKRVVDSLYALMTMIELMGPVRGDWSNYSKLAKGVHHCHLKKGNPTYVAVWKECADGSVEVLYVGTHEKVDYKKFS
ncbi:MAG TPA: cytotoxic translational repressor of toxin-antitoxin stability system [Candidatus Rifleibacterium sp.]|nr:cytotoxic translational repressor of toxin-antitoxin stability system [Candidatus Rifleibacterium sp.]